MRSPNQSSTNTNPGSVPSTDQSLVVSRSAVPRHRAPCGGQKFHQPSRVAPQDCSTRFVRRTKKIEVRRTVLVGVPQSFCTTKQWCARQTRTFVWITCPIQRYSYTHSCYFLVLYCSKTWLLLKSLWRRLGCPFHDVRQPCGDVRLRRHDHSRLVCEEWLMIDCCA